jgi:hypothetical protein
VSSLNQYRRLRPSRCLSTTKNEGHEDNKNEAFVSFVVSWFKDGLYSQCTVHETLNSPRAAAMLDAFSKNLDE